MRVGILTFHEIFNPGAFLQCLGTQTLVERLGHHVEVINYTAPAHRYSPITHAIQLRHRLPFNLTKWYDSIVRDRAFSPDRRNLLKLSPRFKTTAELAEREYDAILIGADIVWNFKDKRLGRDPVYFGHFLNTKRLVSFAPSCGTCSLTDEVPLFVPSGWKKFHRLSVRDENTQAIVRQYTNVEPQILCDPSFHLLDEDILDSLPSNREEYILLYVMPQFATDRLIEQVKMLREELGLPIKAILYRHQYANDNVMNCGPIRWLEYLKNAKFVVTNTFHGIIFASMLNTNFVFERNSAIEKKITRLLATCNLESREFTDTRNVGEILQKNFENKTFLRAAQEQAKAAKEFLIDALH